MKLKSSYSPGIVFFQMDAYNKTKSRRFSTYFCEYLFYIFSNFKRNTIKILMINFVFFKESAQILQIPKRVSGRRTTNYLYYYWTLDFFVFLNLGSAHGQKHRIFIMKTSIINEMLLRLSIPNRWGVMHLTFPTHQNQPMNRK